MRSCDSHLHTGVLWYPYLHNETPRLLPTHWVSVILTAAHWDLKTPTCILRPRDNSIFTLTPGETPSYTMKHHASFMHNTSCDTPPAHWDPVTLTCALRPCDTHACTLKSHYSYLHTGTPRYSYMHIETPTLLPAHWTLRYSSLNNETSEPLPAHWDHVIHIPASWDLWLFLEHWDPGIPTCTLGPWYTSTSTLEPQDPNLHTGTLWYSYPHNETPWLLPANWDPMMLLPTHCRLHDSYMHTGTLWYSYLHTETPRRLPPHDRDPVMHTETPRFLSTYWDPQILLPEHWDPRTLTCTLGPRDTPISTLGSHDTAYLHNDTQWLIPVHYSYLSHWGPMRHPPAHIETLWVSPAYRGLVIFMSTHWDPVTHTCTLGPLDSYLHIGTPWPLTADWDHVILLPVHWDPVILLSAHWDPVSILPTQ